MNANGLTKGFIAGLCGMAFVGGLIYTTPPHPTKSEPPPYAPKTQFGDKGWSVVEFNGHTYVKVAQSSPSSQYSTGISIAVTHDPDCRCQKKSDGPTTSSRNRRPNPEKT